MTPPMASVSWRTEVNESWLTSIFRDRRSHPASRQLDQRVTPAARKASDGGATVADKISLIARSVSTR